MFQASPTPSFPTSHPLIYPLSYFCPLDRHRCLPHTGPTHTTHPLSPQHLVSSPTTFPLTPPPQVCILHAFWDRGVFLLLEAGISVEMLSPLPLPPPPLPHPHLPPHTTTTWRGYIFVSILHTRPLAPFTPPPPHHYHTHTFFPLFSHTHHHTPPL